MYLVFHNLIFIHFSEFYKIFLQETNKKKNSRYLFGSTKINFQFQYS